MKHLYLPAFFLSVLCAISMAACAEKADEPATPESAVTAGATPATALAAAPATPETGTGSVTAETAAGHCTLYMDFTAGSEVPDVRPVELDCTVPPGELSQALTETTGIPFAFTLEHNGDRWTVKWQKDSALWNHDMPQGNPEYVFYDDDLMHWFLMDTVWCTLKEAYGATEVSYRSTDGGSLKMESLWPLEHFDLSQPYRGSSWYYAKSIAYRDKWSLLEQSGQP